MRSGVFFGCEIIGEGRSLTQRGWRTLTEVTMNKWRHEVGLGLRGISGRKEEKWPLDCDCAAVLS